MYVKSFWCFVCSRTSVGLIKVGSLRARLQSPLRGGGAFCLPGVKLKLYSNNSWPMYQVSLRNATFYNENLLKFFFLSLYFIWLNERQNCPARLRWRAKFVQECHCPHYKLGAEYTSGMLTPEQWKLQLKLRRVIARLSFWIGNNLWWYNWEIVKKKNSGKPVLPDYSNINCPPPHKGYSCIVFEFVTSWFIRK